MKKYKAILSEEPMGTKLSLYKKHWLFGWSFQGGLKPIDYNSYGKKLIDDYLERWKKLYGDNLLVFDNRIK